MREQLSPLPFGMGNQKLSEIKRSDVQVHIAKLTKTINPATAINPFLLWAMFNCAIDWNCSKIPTPRPAFRNILSYRVIDFYTATS